MLLPFILHNFEDFDVLRILLQKAEELLKSLRHQFPIEFRKKAIFGPQVLHKKHQEQIPVFQIRDAFQIIILRNDFEQVHLL